MSLQDGDAALGALTSENRIGPSKEASVGVEHE